MKGYSLVKEHDNHFEVSHPQEGSFKVAKGQLDEATLRKIRKLPQGMTNGGEVQKDDPNAALADVQPPSDLSRIYNSLSDEPKAPTPDFTVSPLGSSGLENAQPGDLEALKAKLSSEKPEPTASVTPASYVPGAMKQVSLTGMGGPPAQMQQMGLGMPETSAAFSQMESGLKGQAAAEAEYARQAVKTQQDFMEKQKAADQAWSGQVNDWKKEDERLRNDYSSTKLDPTRAWSSASTGNKVLAGVGILLSGIGSGLAGQDNMALKVINQTIDRDIEAQKVDIGKKSNLISENYRRFGDLRMAEQMTRANLLTSTQSQLSTAAAKMGSAQAQARAQQAIGQLELQKAQIYQGMAVYGMQNQLMSGGAPSGQAGIDPVLANRLFPGQVVNLPKRFGGGVTIAKTKDDAKDMTKSLSSLDALDKLLDEAEAFQKENGTSWLPAKNAQASSIHNGIAMQIGQLHGLNRMSDTDLGLWQEIAPNPGAFFQDKATAKLQALRGMVKDKISSELAAGTVSYNPAQFSLGAEQPRQAVSPTMQTVKTRP